MKIIPGAVAFLIILSSSCKKMDVPILHADASLYFSNPVPDVYSKNPTGVVNLFGLPNTQTDSVIAIKINATGEPKNYDRDFQLLVQDNSTAVAGKDYIMIDEHPALRANTLQAAVDIRLLRSARLDNGDTLKLFLQLVPGKDFTNRIFEDSTTRTIPLCSTLPEPASWSVPGLYYLGPFSTKKFQLLIEIGGMPPNAFDDPDPDSQSLFLLVSRAKVWGSLLKQYLDKMRQLGTPVLERDGTPMVLGFYLN